MGCDDHYRRVYPPTRNSRHVFMPDGDVDAAVDRALEEAENFFAHPDFDDQSELDRICAEKYAASREYCCLHVKIPAVFVFVLCAISYSLKYSIYAGDSEITWTTKLLQVDFFSEAAGDLTIYGIQTACLLGFLISLLTNFRYFLIPYMVHQWVLIILEYIVAIVYIVLTVTGNMYNFEGPAHAFLQRWSKIRLVENIRTGATSVPPAMLISAIALGCVTLNIFIASIVKRLYYYQKYRAAYYNVV